MNPKDRNKTFQELFNEAFSARSFSAAKLAEASGVPERFIEALRVGNYTRLPAAPYVRGYITRIAPLIGVDGEELWQLYKNEIPAKTSGGQDRLPFNRFSIKKISKRNLTAAIFILGILVFAAVRFNDIMGQPSLEVRYPRAATIIVNSDIIKVDGFVNPSDKLDINSEDINVAQDGYFEKELNLDPGVNTVEFQVKRFLGKETKIIKKIIYQP